MGRLNDPKARIMSTVTEREPSAAQPAEPIARVRDLCDRGLFLQAYRAAEDIGPLDAWTGTSETLLAARLAVNLAAPTLANWLMRRAWRNHPQNAEARFYNGLRIFRRRGPYWVWRWTEQAGEPDPSTPAEHRGYWLALRGSAAAALRDFSTAEVLLDRAVKLAPKKSYPRLCRASLLQYEDRYAEALAVAREVMRPTRTTTRPWNVPAICSRSWTATKRRSSC